MCRFHRSNVSGVLRIGLPTDYAVAFPQSTLTTFLRNNPDVDLEIRCDLSCELHRLPRSDDLDIIVATMPARRMFFLSRARVERPVWAAAEGFALPPDRPVPLAAHLGGCDDRARVIDALDAASRRWRIVYTGPGISGLPNAVPNGICLTALARTTGLPGMRELTEAEGFPKLEPLRIGLFSMHPRLSVPGLKLVSDLVAGLESVGSGVEPCPPGESRADNRRSSRNFENRVRASSPIS